MRAYSKYIMRHRGRGRFVKHQTFVMNNIYDLDAPIIQIHGLFMIILSNVSEEKRATETYTVKE